MKPTSDSGSSPVELLLFGIAVPAMIVPAALGLFAAERHAIQAQQLAREAVRFAAIGEYSQSVQRVLEKSLTGLGAGSAASIEVTKLVLPDGTECFEAKATVLGAIETARMRATS